MVLLQKTLQKRAQNTVFAQENRVWEDTVSKFSRLRRLHTPDTVRRTIINFDTSFDMIWYDTVDVSNVSGTIPSAQTAM